MNKMDEYYSEHPTAGVRTMRSMLLMQGITQYEPSNSPQIRLLGTNLIVALCEVQDGGHDALVMPVIDRIAHIRIHLPPPKAGNDEKNPYEFLQNKFSLSYGLSVNSLSAHASLLSLHLAGTEIKRLDEFLQPMFGFDVAPDPFPISKYALAHHAGCGRSMTFAKSLFAHLPVVGH